MIVTEAAPYFQDRRDAGQKLAGKLGDYMGKGGVVVFAVPRGGVPVAIEVAQDLGCPLDLVIPRKIPIPFNTEAGYGAVTEDGAVVLNEPLVRDLRLTQSDIELQAEEIKAEIRRRTAVYRAVLKPSSVKGKIAIVIDDGLASGYTMMAAIKSLRGRGAAAVVVAVPVASAGAWEFIRPAAEVVISLIVAHTYQFAVASYYRSWHDLTDEEVIEALAAFTQNQGGYDNA